MSAMKNGFSTLNRWLGKKNKEKTVASNGKLSKSSANLSLSISTTDINETSLLEYNRITPLPAMTSNEPFEQNFRITVLLPKDQLYVTRLGARIPLSKLLELVCENKLLNADKYEFRNPVDASQVFDLKLSIGAVGLSEVRLCLKTEPYDNFNTDEVIKLRRTAGMRGSCSSSEFSSRQSKHTNAKTISPYSSSNSLNSLESNSVHYARVPVTPTSPNVPTTVPKVTAPPRKKRAAPRPPSQITIHEQETLTNGDDKLESTPVKEENAVILGKKNYYVSTPDLVATSLTPFTIVENNNNDNINNNTTPNGFTTPEQIIDANELYARVEKKNVRNLAKYGGSVQNLSTTAREGFPEPSPRKRIIQVKNKKAPAPPASSRNTTEMPEEERSIIQSTTPDPKEVESTPIPTARETISVTKLQEEVVTTPKSQPQPVPRNVSKVILNRTPTPEPRSISSDTAEVEQISVTHISDNHNQSTCDDDDAASKQADSGIGEPVPSPLPDSLQSEGSTHECKSTFESSSDDDEMIRVYNFKLGKTVIQPLVEHEMLQIAPTTPTTPATPTSITAINTTESTPKLNADGEKSPLTAQPTPAISETASWNFCIPISPPPNFADENGNKQNLPADEIPDTPITPKITERPVLNFEALTKEESNQKKSNNAESSKIEKEFSRESSVSNPLDGIVDELSAIIQQKGVTSLMKKPAPQQEIESAKPNTLSNFSIVSIEQGVNTFPSTIKKNAVIENNIEEEQVVRKRSSLNLRINRADSFHTATDIIDSPQLNGLNSRSSSCAALAKLEPTVNNIVTRGKSSSSELSIKESPSLQSLEIIKTILNSRKNSLVSSGSDGEKPVENVDQSMEIKPKKEEAEELPKIYRYSGPPSINLGSWNDRPKKGQIAIKNEGDYIFGGKNATKANAVVEKIAAFKGKEEKKDDIIISYAKPKSPVIETKVESPTKRMGIPESEFRVPITVRPLKDFIVESTPIGEHNPTATTLPRNKNQQIAAIKRSTSISALEAAKTQKQSESVNEAPFGQNTLRKTGLKEKILSSNEEAKENNCSNEENTIQTKNIFAMQLRKQQSHDIIVTRPPIKPNKMSIPLNKSISVPGYPRVPAVAPKSAITGPPPPPFKPLKTTKVTPTTPTTDTRDELLDSIRNFKREKLKQNNSQN